MSPSDRWAITKVTLSGKAIIALVLVAVIGSAAAVFSFTQHFPAIPPAAAPPVLTAGCTTSSLVTTTTSVTPGGSAIVSILFTCPSGTAAITASANGGVATPTFTLPTTAGYTGLALVTHTVGATTCAGGFGIASGTAVTFSPSEVNDYCASATMIAGTGLPAFDITWSG